MLIVLFAGVCNGQVVDTLSLDSNASKTDSVLYSGILSDSTFSDSLLMDSLGIDSLALDSLRMEQAMLDSLANLPPKRKSPLDHPVDYNAEDSMIFDLSQKKVYLYGNAVATYGDIELKADYIEISLETKELYATGLPDSTGELAGTPIFKQGSQTFDSEEMEYNFESQRGLSKRVITQENDGYLHGERVKKDTGNIIYIKGGKYTTCEYKDPHFHIHANKLKVIQQDKIVTGPAYLSIENIPTPLALPFGLFPNSESRANGLIVPAYGESPLQGFFLNRGGYYFGYKDYADFALTGDIYSRGSWALYLANRYAVKYKFRGNLDIEYVNSRFSEPEYPDFSTESTYQVRWTHNQDPKAKPNSNFVANVNFGSPRNGRNNIQSDASDYLRANLNSSIRYTQSFPNASVPITANISGTSSSTVNDQQTTLNFPNVSLNMARVFPFRRQERVGKEKIYEKIGINSSFDLQNQIRARQDSLFTERTLNNNMRNGARWSASMSLNQKAGPLNFTPQLNVRSVGTLQTIDQYYDPELGVRTDQIDGPDGFVDGNASLTMSTIVYGLYQYKSEVVKAMRHQLTPSISFSYAPDFSDPTWGYFETIQRDSTGRTLQYSRFQGGLLGTPRAKENGVVSFSLNNTFELKVRERNDSADTDKKLKLLDAFNFSSSYNIAQDSMNWAPINIQVRTQVVPGLQFNGNAVLDPYARSVTGERVNEFQLDRNGKIGTWTTATGALNWRIQPKQTKEEKKRQQEKEEQLTARNLYYTDFVDFDIPWSLNVNYNIRYSNNGTQEDVTNNIGITGDVSLTRNWKIQGRTNYDITNDDFGYSEFTILRDLHCWEFSLRVVPFGIRQQYRFQINVKSPMLQDLKLNRNRNFTVPDR